MAYPTFPDLSRGIAFGVKEAFDDPTLRDKMENGAVATRPRYSRARRTFTVPYRLLTATDRQVIREFQRSVVVGSTPFLWVDTRDQENVETVTVRLGKPIEIEDDQYAGGQKRWKTTLELVEL